ncbi:unnamed protein product [Nezara viridula]|uniref:Uncharacterized protein n=1 Tax=Nezara viridula TaxID=85310 RepID=A0A9P0E885_NEZVI|nr:unnamed protein product [Nezara viridula]
MIGWGINCSACPSGPYTGAHQLGPCNMSAGASLQYWNGSSKYQRPLSHRINRQSAVPTNAILDYIT